MIYKWNIVGHQQQLERLENEIKTGNIAHAYLFSGARQGGKFSIAKTFAAILQCPNNYCKTCDTCRQVQAGRHSDTLIMEDDGESIKIDEVRELIRKTNLTHQGRYRVVVLENIERMAAEAQNSFLKTLEEPPSDTIFLLTTSQLDAILLTIQSRVRHYHFSTIDDRALAEYLQATFGSRPEMDEAISMAQGRPGLAITLMKDPNAFSHQKNLYRQIETFLSKNNLAQKFSFAETLEKNPEDLERFLDAFTRYLRKLILDYTVQPRHPLKERFDLRALTKLFDVLEKTRYFIKRNVNKKLALENLLIQTEKL